MCDAVQFKKKCEQMIGVVSQCMVKPRNLNIQYLANLALKINLKVCTIIIAFALFILCLEVVLYGANI